MRPTTDGFEPMLPRLQAVIEEACAIAGLPTPPVEPTIFEVDDSGTEAGRRGAYAAESAYAMATYSFYCDPEFGVLEAIIGDERHGLPRRVRGKLPLPLAQRHVAAGARHAGTLRSAPVLSRERRAARCGGELICSTSE